MDAVNGFDAMVGSFPFVWCRGVEEFLHGFLAFFGECPSPAWSFSGAESVPVDAVGVSLSFEFDHAASQALGRVSVSEVFCYLRQLFLGDWFFDGVEDYDYVDLWGAVH